jgi:hypothetical protein
LAELILKDNLGLKPYKLPDLHEIEKADINNKDWLFVIGSSYLYKLSCYKFSNESYFELALSANKQNNRLRLETLNELKVNVENSIKI